MRLLSNLRCLTGVAFLIAALSTGLDAQLLQQQQEKREPIADWAAFHRNDDSYFAGQSHLSSKEVRKLRLAAGISDDQPVAIFDIVRAKLQDGHILLVTKPENDSCLSTGVYKRVEGEFQEIWSAADAPGVPKLCYPSHCPAPKVSVNKSHEIVLSLPAKESDLHPGVCDQQLELHFQRKGATYQLAEQQTEDAPCHTQTYLDLLNVAFRERTPGAQRLATIEVFPAFWPAWIIRFDQDASGVKVTRVNLDEKRTAEIFRRGNPTRCIKEAIAAADRRTVAASPDRVQKLLDRLAGIAMKIDQCPRHPNGTCADFTDPTITFVAAGNAAPVELFATTGMTDVLSQNPMLESWVNDVVAMVGETEPPVPQETQYEPRKHRHH